VLRNENEEFGAFTEEYINFLEMTGYPQIDYLVKFDNSLISLHTHETELCLSF